MQEKCSGAHEREISTLDRALYLWLNFPLNQSCHGRFRDAPEVTQDPTLAVALFKPNSVYQRYSNPQSPPSSTFVSHRLRTTSLSCGIFQLLRSLGYPSEEIL